MFSDDLGRWLDREIEERQHRRVELTAKFEIFGLICTGMALGAFFSSVLPTFAVFIVGVLGTGIAFYGKKRLRRRQSRGDNP